ncbi:MAG TPA: LytTR family DNA-binding domain-containing protein [Longimicrobiaceae bacterium]|nr:LytTR family DNA-binding domain-containing protein [Longimicrobiaceae bacterium]
MTSSESLRVLIVDDELLARQRLEDLLEKEERVEIVGMIDNGTSAVEAIRTLKPDLVFLDVQMPGMTGLEVVTEVGADDMPAIIFVTAFDQHALRAFELTAIDYLVKPFDDDRFEQAFRRARRMVELEEVGRMTGRLLTLLKGETRSSPEYLERIAVEMRGQVRVIPVDQIDYISSSGAYAELHVGDRKHVLRERMQNLEDRLDPAIFFRIHRSAIVRIDRIESFMRSSGGEYAVKLRGGTELSVSRNRREELEQRLGME